MVVEGLKKEGFVENATTFSAWLPGSKIIVFAAIINIEDLNTEQCLLEIRCCLKYWNYYQPYTLPDKSLLVCTYRYCTSCTNLGKNPALCEFFSYLALSNILYVRHYMNPFTVPILRPRLSHVMEHAQNETPLRLSVETTRKEWNKVYEYIFRAFLQTLVCSSCQYIGNSS